MIQAYKEVPNHFLLYHGSMMFNFIGILSQGLKIAPPEAPATGYMFGRACTSRTCSIRVSPMPPEATASKRAS